MKISFKKIMCLVLVAVMFVTGTTSVYAARAKKYVSDLKISYDYDGAKSKQALIDQGYIVIAKDLNEKADDILSKKRVVYLGYKITQNPEEAITDVAMMSEQNGYSFSDYHFYLRKKLDSFDELTVRQMDLIIEFRKCYEEGRPLALTAYKALNNYIEDDGRKLIGDYFLDERLGHYDLRTLITEASQSMITMFNTLLVAAVAEDIDDNFMKRLTALSPEQIAEMKLDETLHDDVVILYEQALALKEDIIYSQKFLNSVNAMTEEELAAKNEDEKWSHEVIENSKSAVVGEMLKETMIGDKSFYDLIMQDEFSIIELYPLAGVLNKGQVAAINFGGYTQYISSFSALSEEEEEELVEVNTDKTQAISAYIGVDRTMFTDEVAITNSAMREMNATGDKSALYGRSDERIINEAIVLGAALGVGVITGAYVYGMSKMATNLIYPKGVETAMNLLKSTDIANAIKATLPYATDTISSAGNPVLRAAFNLTKVAPAFLILSILAVLIIPAMLHSDLMDFYNPEYTKIPKIMLEFMEGKEESNLDNYVRYNVVNGQDDNPGDLNGFAGKRWNALYFSKDSTAGKPIEATTTVANNNTTVKGASYLPIHEFGNRMAVNLNNFTFSNSSTPTYLYFTQDINYKPATTASVFSNRWSPLVTGLVGVLLGFGGCFFIMRRHKVDQTPPQQNTIG